MLLESFPVVQVVSLEPTALFGWSGIGQRARLLPPRQPGTVRVFEIDGDHIPERSGPQSRNLSLIAKAGSVSVVDVLPRTLEMTVPLTGPVDVPSCRLRLGFRCQVIDPTIVARDHLIDLPAALGVYFSQHQRLRYPFDVSTLERLKQRLNTQFSVRPIRVAGMRIDPEFMFVDVDPPLGPLETRMDHARREHTTTGH